jgi:PAS domain S-box-containing protein
LSPPPDISLALVKDAVQNLTIIAALLLVYYFIPSDRFSRSKVPYSVRIGIFFAFIAIASSPSIWGTANAPRLGLNVVLVPLAALIGGPAAAILTGAFLLMWIRMFAGTWTGADILTVISLILLGILFYYGRSRERFPRTPLVQLVLLGLGVVLIEFCSSLFLIAPLTGGDPVSVVISFTPYFFLSFVCTIICGSLIGFIKRKKDAEAELRAAYQQLSAADEELRKQYDELAENEQRIRESEEKYRAVVTLASDGIHIIQDGMFRFVNPRAAALHGKSAEDLLNTPFISFVHPDEQKRVEAIYRQRMDGEPAPPVYETVIVNARGESVDVEVGSQRIMFEGKISDLVVMRDVTERRRSQMALDRAKKKLNMLNYVTFTDIQNMVFSLRGYLHLHHAAVKEAVSRDTDALAAKENTLLQYIEDSLKFARAYQDLGMRPARWQDVSRVFLLAISHLDLLGVHHTVRTDGLEIFADPLLERVFLILADNTLVHSGTGTEVTVGYVREPDGSLTLIFADNGAGIPRADKERIFLPEYQQKKTEGLFLAWEILEITGITMKETGMPGTGVRFEMHVPKGAYRFSGNPRQLADDPETRRS